MTPEYILVQAGGKGTRLGYLTRNKPKALVPVENLPALFHLFRKYPKSRYIIIGDYHFEVLERYLAAFAPVDYRLVCARGFGGTCAGLREALTHIPAGKPFLLIWSDLILPESFDLPKAPGNYIGLAGDFPCRWKYENNTFTEERSETFGVAGVFFFQDTSFLETVPYEGEFVRWLSTQRQSFQSLPLCQVKEFGLLSDYQRLEPSRCRPFNRVYREDGLFVKEPLDAQGEELARREAAWYRRAAEHGFASLPDIFSYRPLKMEYIPGGPIYERGGLSRAQKSRLLRQIVACLRSLHALGQMPADPESYWEAYIGKTFQRLEKVRGLVPFADADTVTVNGRRCRNVFSRRGELEQALKESLPPVFRLIHGDCTFSNILLRMDGSPVLIDPRGYFGHTELYGDPAYDWAKLYYSLVGNYDQFNRGRFDLTIAQSESMLRIASNGWEELEDEFFHLLEGEATKRQLRLIHAIIWLSLTTYAWHDYDSVCGAFYNGLYHLEEAL